MRPAPARAQRAQRSPDAVVAAPVAPPANDHTNGHAEVIGRADAHGPLGSVPLQKARKPMGQLRQKLDNAERPGFHRHWFNDDKGRIQSALDAGYAHVLDNEGKPMSHIVGNKKEGGAMVAYRMEIPLEFWQQDQNEKTALRRERQHQTQHGDGRSGDDGRYLPKGPDGKPLTQIKHGDR